MHALNNLWSIIIVQLDFCLILYNNIYQCTRTNWLWHCLILLLPCLQALIQNFTRTKMAALNLLTSLATTSSWTLKALCRLEYQMSPHSSTDTQPPALMHSTTIDWQGAQLASPCDPLSGADQENAKIQIRILWMMLLLRAAAACHAILWTKISNLCISELIVYYTMSCMLLKYFDIIIINAAEHL